MNVIQQAAGMSGRFSLVATNLVTGKSRRVAEFDNLITNFGLNEIGTDFGWPFGRICLGTGTTPPSPSDAALQAQGCFSSFNTGVPSNQENGVAEAGGYEWTRFSRRFNQGVATGTWTEIGIGLNGNAAPSGGLFSRALITDGSGNPTSITILPIEVLDASYEVRVYWPSADVTGSIVISGNTHSYIMRRYTTGSFDGWATYFTGYPGNSRGRNSYPGALTAHAGEINTGSAQPFGPSAGGSPISGSEVSVYSSSTFYNDFRVVVGSDGCNVPSGLIRTLAIDYPVGKVKCRFDPPLAKDNTKTLSFTRRVSWARRP